FQFYQPKATFSFNPIFVLICSASLLVYSFYFLAQFIPFLDRSELYFIELPFHFIVILFLLWVLFYEWWFLKNELRSEYGTQRLLRIQEDLKNSEIKNIQQNVQPHFLFNSLNSINSLMLFDVEEAQKMIVQLSEFLRHSVLKNQSLFVKIEDEINQVNRYFSIEKIRFSNRLEYSIEFDENLNDVEIPSMLLQPLLENAIKFGLYGQVEKGVVRLQLFRKREYIYVQMTNSFDPEHQNTKGTGFGLKSIKQKLYWLYAEGNLVETKVLDREFVVQIKIPIRKNEGTIN
ncbi:MAG: histidine kinase, partial [Bacteroidetes bacterium]|nr:histidine kinase [Bacteroidota bacterium]